MITPQEEEMWKDSSGNKYMTFIHSMYTHEEISFIGRFGNFFQFKNVVHGEDGWERVFPEVNDGEN